jgi:hypothetical protein
MMGQLERGGEVLFTLQTEIKDLKKEPVKKNKEIAPLWDCNRALLKEFEKQKQELEGTLL